MNVFPIKTSTSCQLKWVWSTLYLNSGVTRSCHRTAESQLTAENFNDFHNTTVKMQDRISMVKGQWPDTNCRYCKDIEDVGGVSDRLRHMTVPYVMPPELNLDSTAIRVSPTVLEVYFNNTCNLGCIYCSSKSSSFIASENNRHGDFRQHGVWLTNHDRHFKTLLPKFWEWFSHGFSRLSRLNVLGGEPLLQTEFDTLLEMIDRYPNPDCELNIVTNLMVPIARLKTFLSNLESLWLQKKIRRIDITCSIDCWGTEQEYVRWGLDLAQWEQNFLCLLDQPHLYLNINQTISPLTIKTMPILLQKIARWREQHQIGHWFSEVSPGPEYLKPHILGNRPFVDDFAHILSIMPRDSDENIIAHNYMSSIFNHISSCSKDPEKIRDLVVFLNENDRRRGTNWQSTFSWLVEEVGHVV